jgi:tetratricopeptide (TPR) repeat protein
LGKDHPDLVWTLVSFAWLYIDTDNWEKAEPYANRALEISEKAFGPEHPYVADSLNYLGRVLYARGEHDKSIAITASGHWQSGRNSSVPDHFDTGVSLNNLACRIVGSNNTI